MEEYYLMWLSRLDGFGIRRINYLLEHFGSVEAIWRAESSEFRAVHGMGEKMTEQLISSIEFLTFCFLLF